MRCSGNIRVVFWLVRTVPHVNAQPMDEEGIARYVREQNIGLVGIGAMTRMIAKAYRTNKATPPARERPISRFPCNVFRVFSWI
jgi:hypothetical protein